MAGVGWQAQDPNPVFLTPELCRHSARCCPGWASLGLALCGGSWHKAALPGVTRPSPFAGGAWGQTGLAQVQTCHLMLSDSELSHTLGPPQFTRPRNGRFA